MTDLFAFWLHAALFGVRPFGGVSDLFHVRHVPGVVMGPGTSAASARSGEASASSVGPIISVSGVRNSWLTLEKKAILARSSSASALARRRSSS